MNREIKIKKIYYGKLVNIFLKNLHLKNKFLRARTLGGILILTFLAILVVQSKSIAIDVSVTSTLPNGCQECEDVPDAPEPEPERTSNVTCSETAWGATKPGDGTLNNHPYTLLPGCFADDAWKAFLESVKTTVGIIYRCPYHPPNFVCLNDIETLTPEQACEKLLKFPEGPITIEHVRSSDKRNWACDECTKAHEEAHLMIDWIENSLKKEIIKFNNWFLNSNGVTINCDNPDTLDCSTAIANVKSEYALKWKSFLNEAIKTWNDIAKNEEQGLSNTGYIANVICYQAIKDALEAKCQLKETNFYCDDDNDDFFDSSIDGTCSGLECLPQGCQDVAGNDCNDLDPRINPGELEKCDGKDNDCNPTAPDGFGENWYGKNCDGPDSDKCEEGVYECNNGIQICSDNTEDNIEICDGIDNDCNPITPDGSGENWFENITACGAGVCRNMGQFICHNGMQMNTCAPHSPTEIPESSCTDNLDNDCDGFTDNNDTDCSPFKITTCYLMDGVLNTPYNHTLETKGGLLPITWNISAGNMPPGLTFNSNGNIAGMPITSGTYSFTLRAVDAASVPNIDLQDLSLTITDSYSDRVYIKDCDLPVGKIGEPYNHHLLSTGGILPVNWTISDGNLPPGLNLSSDGIISGLPTTVDNYILTIKTVDSASPPTEDKRDFLLQIE